MPDLTANAGVGLGSVKRIKQTLDTSVNNLALNEVAQLIPVPANSFVALVRHEVTTVEGGAATFEVGDGSDTNGYGNAINANALSVDASGPISLVEGTPNTIAGYSGGKYYSAADTIDLKALAAMDAAVVEVEAIIYTFD